MAKLSRLLVLIGCVLFFLSDHLFAATYYVASSGSDSNNGTSEATPLLHAPGMPNCKATCASVSPQAGDKVIFRGGDTWHFGNSSASPYTGGTLTWAWSGTANSQIYIGVDQSWYSGSSWSRPVFTGDNPTSTTAVASCSHQIGNTNVLLEFNETQYYQLDNIELTGVCESNSNLGYGNNAYISDGNIGPSIYSSLYIHGWTHLAYSCSGGSGFCFNLTGIIGGSGGQNVIENSVFDGSDSDPAGIAAIFNAIYDVHDSVIRYTANVLGGNCHTFHDNLVEYSYEPGDNVAHGNIYECNGEVSVSTPNTFYNNVIRNTGTAVGVGIWPEPNQGATDYYFNNVMYGTQCGGGNCFNLGQNSSNQGTLVIFNNTFQNPANTAIIVDNGTKAYTHPLLSANNHYITNAANGVSTAGTWTSATELTTSQSTATSDSYTSSETYAYSPTSSSSPTVGKGTSEFSSYCNALSGDTTAYSSCQSDISYGCSYNTTNHTVSCPAKQPNSRPATGAWDIGAFQYGQNGLVPAQPTSLTAVVH